MQQNLSHNLKFINMTTTLQNNTETVIPSIKEALRLIGIKEIAANIYSLPVKKVEKSSKKVEMA